MPEETQMNRIEKLEIKVNSLLDSGWVRLQGGENTTSKISLVLVSDSALSLRDVLKAHGSLDFMEKYMEGYVKKLQKAKVAKAKKEIENGFSIGDKVTVITCGGRFHAEVRNINPAFGIGMVYKVVGEFVFFNQVRSEVLIKGWEEKETWEAQCDKCPIVGCNAKGQMGSPGDRK